MHITDRSTPDTPISAGYTPSPNPFEGDILGTKYPPTKTHAPEPVSKKAGSRRLRDHHPNPGQLGSKIGPDFSPDSDRLVLNAGFTPRNTVFDESLQKQRSHATALRTSAPDTPISAGYTPSPNPFERDILDIRYPPKKTPGTTILRHLQATASPLTLTPHQVAKIFPATPLANIAANLPARPRRPRRRLARRPRRCSS